MRISTSLLYRQGTNAMSSLQRELSRTQLQIATGQRLVNPSDDPVANARMLELNATIERSEQYSRNGNMARNRLAIEEQNLSDVGDVLVRARELLLQASNDTQSNETRAAIANELETRLDQLVQIANARDGEGEYLFGGFKSQTQPFVRNGSQVLYQGDQGQRAIRLSDTRSVFDGDSGDGIFMAVAEGSGRFVVSADAANTGTAVIGLTSLQDYSAWNAADYSINFTAPDAYEARDAGGALVQSGSFNPGDSIQVAGVSITVDGSPAAGDTLSLSPARSVDVFSNMQDAIDTLRRGVGDPASRARLHNDLNASLNNLDRGLDNVLDYRTRIGVRLQAIEDTEVSNGDFVLTLQTARADLQELDYAEAISRLSQQLTSLEAAQQSFVRLQNLSLFNLL